MGVSVGLLDGDGVADGDGERRVGEDVAVSVGFGVWVLVEVMVWLGDARAVRAEGEADDPSVGMLVGPGDLA